uniref:Uncharacterized protein n=1 Tax=Vespula pensylvanica TaxID=30213 RepID=A0A834U952_VESPE|nr:hypothetical protein H0235_008408 [Vespula pensylvanica]
MRNFNVQPSYDSKTNEQASLRCSWLQGRTLTSTWEITRLLLTIQSKSCLMRGFSHGDHCPGNVSSRRVVSGGTSEREKERNGRHERQEEMEEDKRKNRTEDDKIGDDVEDVESSALTVKGMAFGEGVGEVKRRIGGGGGGDGDGGSSGGGGGGGGGGGASARKTGCSCIHVYTDHRSITTCSCLNVRPAEGDKEAGKSFSSRLDSNLSAKFYMENLQDRL